MEAEILKTDRYLALISQIPSDVGTDSSGQHHRYPSLRAVRAHIQPHLQEAGLLWTQWSEGIKDGAQRICGILWEEASGEMVGIWYTDVPVADEPMDMGSSQTYGFRYQSYGVFGLIPHDDDGAGASPRRSAPPAANTQGRPQATQGRPPQGGGGGGGQTISDAQAKRAYAIIMEAARKMGIDGKDHMANILAACGWSRIQDCPWKKYNELIAKIQGGWNPGGDQVGPAAADPPAGDDGFWGNDDGALPF